MKPSWEAREGRRLTQMVGERCPREGEQSRALVLIDSKRRQPLSS